MKLKSIKSKKQEVAEAKEFINERFADRPERLLTSLGIRRAPTSGFCCPNCNSGRGPKGTGMTPFCTTETKKFRFKCFSCDECFDAIALVRAVNKDMSFSDALDLLVNLYTPEHDPVNDRELHHHCRSSMIITGRSLTVDDALMDTYRKSIYYRMQCPTWQQAVADKLGVPFETLNRPDVGKSFDESNGANPDCGDLVTFNLLDGVPVSLKVRYTPGIGTGRTMDMLDCNTNRFTSTWLRDGSQRSFRMAGANGKLCFGHDSIKDNISTVVIAEGQSDVLAICAAAHEVGISDLTAIGRDSACHILSDADLKVLAGKNIIYCQDFDKAGRQVTSENGHLLHQYCDNVRIWTTPDYRFKDPRALYNAIGASEFMNHLLSL